MKGADSMDKRSKKRKEIERSRYAETFRDGFDHGFKMGYDQAKREMKGSGLNDNQMDKMDRQDDQK